MTTVPNGDEKFSRVIQSFLKRSKSKKLNYSADRLLTVLTLLMHTFLIKICNNEVKEGLALSMTYENVHCPHSVVHVQFMNRY